MEKLTEERVIRLFPKHFPHLQIIKLESNMGNSGEFMRWVECMIWKLLLFMKSRCIFQLFQIDFITYFLAHQITCSWGAEQATQ